jgi:type I restriction enzyme S subunit
MSDLGKYPLPKGWTWATIPDLVGETGVFVDGDWVESIDQDPSGNVRLIQLADVGDGVYRDKSERFMTKAKAEELRCTFLNEGDVLIAPAFSLAIQSRLSPWLTSRLHALETVGLTIAGWPVS